MKILYITLGSQRHSHGGSCMDDYLNDLMFHGFYELFNNQVVDSGHLQHMFIPYKEQLRAEGKYLHSRGFTAPYLIDEDNIDRTNIEDKISNRYFDLIIYGSAWRCQDYLGLVSQKYAKNQVVFFDGEDHTRIHPITRSFPYYFKRELMHHMQNVYPISFGMPLQKILSITNNKTKMMGTVIPGESSTYIFTDEKAYFEDYGQSFYGLTQKKGGWDCMRHYEILGSGAIPYFTDLHLCPSTMMTHLPKELILKGMALKDRDPFPQEEYFKILEELHLYTKNHLTTKAMAQYVLDTIGSK